MSVKRRHGSCDRSRAERLVDLAAQLSIACSCDLCEKERRLVQVMPQGANTFAPDGSQVMTFNLTNNGEGWLDPSSLRLHFRIVNTAPAGATLRLTTC